MAVPKKRKSKSRRDMRRAQHDWVAAPGLVPCSNCGEMKLPHRICPHCGYHAGRQIVEMETDEG